MPRLFSANPKLDLIPGKARDVHRYPLRRRPLVADGIWLRNCILNIGAFIAALMTTSQPGVGRTEPMCSLPVVTTLVVSQLMDSQPLDPVKTMLEHLVASMARFEA